MESVFVNTANRACSLIYSYIKKYNQGTWLMPVNVCPDVPLTFYLAGVDIEFVDINPITYCIDEKACLERLMHDKGRYAGLVYVRTYGRMSDTSSFVSECKSISPLLKVIDDRCLCIPDRNPIMYNADMVLFSTGHCKQIDLGGGGLAYYANYEPYSIDESLFYNATNEESIYKEAYKQETILNPVPMGWLKMDKFMPWEKYMNVIEAKVEARKAYRSKLNHIYTLYLPKNIQLGLEYNDWRFNILVPSDLKDNILQALFDKGLFASNHYHSVNRLFDDKEYPNSDALYSCVINLFNDKYYTEDMAKKTCEIIASFPLMGGVILRVRNCIWGCLNTIAA